MFYYNYVLLFKILISPQNGRTPIGWKLYSPQKRTDPIEGENSIQYTGWTDLLKGEKLLSPRIDGPSIG